MPCVKCPDIYIHKALGKNFQTLHFFHVLSNNSRNCLKALYIVN